MLPTIKTRLTNIIAKLAGSPDYEPHIKPKFPIEFYLDKAVDKILDGEIGGVTERVKQALLNCFDHVAWDDDKGELYYNALEAALYDRPELESISAVYNQSTRVYSTTSLDSLKEDLVVTAIYSDGSTLVVPAEKYTLTGTLTEGESTVTVKFAGKSTTFVVVVTPILWTFLVDCTVVKGTDTGSGKVWRQATSARSCGKDPIENKNYVFTVTDPAKYNIAAYDVSSITKITTSVPTSALDGYYYACGNKSITWKESDSVSTPYVWLALKKMDGTSFTEEELANGAVAVFTFTEGQ